MIFGFLRAVLDLQRQFSTQKVVFCWDHGRAIVRERLFPDYKLKRREKERTKEEQWAEQDYQMQVDLLKLYYLAEIGFRNNFFVGGYEADDLLAQLCITLWKSHPEDEVVLVSADKDLYQLLDGHIYIWNPASKQYIGDNDVRLKYKVRADQWVKVKAIAGCSSDEIKGVKGIGEKRACGYLNGSLPKTSRYYQAIEDAWGTVVLPNLWLVTLPFPGTPEFELQEDEVLPSKWKAVTKKLGMDSLRDMF